MTPQKLLKQFYDLKNRRQNLETTWQECYAFALPQREGCFLGNSALSAPSLFDGTAPDAVDQLAASMLSELTPPWIKWFDLDVGSNVSKDESSSIAHTLEKISDILAENLDKSSFGVEMHQCFLDLVTVGTACLLFEENALGAKTAFKFTAIPVNEIYVDEGPSGRLDTLFRVSQMDIDTIVSRFSMPIVKTSEQDKYRVLECVIPRLKGGYDYTVFLMDNPDNLFGKDEYPILKQGYFETSPFLVFRWQKTAGEIYGRSPVMKALPDIKTANKVVELILKNATIAVTGIWQAEDDGVLNPSNIRLTPGAIIPKAVGSKGLSPLQTAGDFDVSELVLSDLRNRIRHALLVDKLGQVENPKMTATEVLERSAEMVRILGATYGRLQSELLHPLVERGLAILRRRGLIPEIFLDGRLMRVHYQSPIARMQKQQEAQNALTWLSSVQQMGQTATDLIDLEALVRWLAGHLNVPMELLKKRGVVYENTMAV